MALFGTSLILLLKNLEFAIIVFVFSSLSLVFEESPNGYLWKCVETCSSVQSSTITYDHLSRNGRIRTIIFKAITGIVKLEYTCPSCMEEKVTNRFAFGMVST